MYAIRTYPFLLIKKDKTILVTVLLKSQLVVLLLNCYSFQTLLALLKKDLSITCSLTISLADIPV